MTTMTLNPHHHNSPKPSPPPLTKTITITTHQNLTIATHQNLHFWLRFYSPGTESVGFKPRYNLWLRYVSTPRPPPSGLLVFSLRNILWYRFSSSRLLSLSLLSFDFFPFSSLYSLFPSPLSVILVSIGIWGRIYCERKIY